ncbi:tetratricopeptide repeat protein [Planctomycetota bacterium]
MIMLGVNIIHLLSGSRGILEPKTETRNVRTLKRRLSGRTRNTLRQTKPASRTVVTAGNSTLAINLGSTSFSSNRRGSIRTGRKHHRPAFEDRGVGTKRHRHELSFRNRRRRLSNRIIWPKYRYTVRYKHRRNLFSYRYVYPYYHRKYVFISLGGYWPSYSYRRYYWYGYHPYNWYGYDPVPYEVRGDTNNYYTYNYYGDNGQIQPVDHTTFADVREKMAQRSPTEPADETDADRVFAKAVKAFEAEDYSIAAENIEQAIELSPDDIILPFAYSQALLADQQYHAAAEVLRSALEKSTPDEQSVFYPRGLYPDEKTLTEHIERLEKKADMENYNTDLQLLLGYQMLGTGEIDQAIEHLDQADFDAENTHAVATLTELAEKIKADQDDD